MQGYLLLADGSRFDGELVGAGVPVGGELVFNTSMTGYQEIVTDPSYHRQIVVLTFPEIGNYGCADILSESHLAHAAGMVFREYSPGTWHRENDESFGAFLKRIGVTAITGVDTRRLTSLIRDQGPQNAMIFPATVDQDEAARTVAGLPAMEGANLVPEVSTEETRIYGASGETHIVLLDFGIKIATIRALVERGCRVTQVPYDTSFESIVDMKPHGIMLSNGPGDPSALGETVETVGKLIDRFPTMGICLGFQLMARSLGGKTYKLPFGHRGGNHPVKFNDRVIITAQNHGFAVDEKSLDESKVRLTHRSLFDGSLEGFEVVGKPVFGVQFHPEAAPGPHDSHDHFDYFLKLVRGDHA